MGIELRVGSQEGLCVREKASVLRLGVEILLELCPGYGEPLMLEVGREAGNHLVWIGPGEIWTKPLGDERLLDHDYSASTKELR